MGDFSVVTIAEFRETKIQQLHAVWREHHVTGLEVAMNHVLGVGSIERLGDPCGNRDSLIDRERAELQTLGECFPLEELHHKERNTLVFADIVHCADGRVVHPRNCTSFTLEPIEFGALDTTGTAEHLDGHGPVESGIPRAVDLAHPSGSDQGHNFVRTDSGAHVQ